jgi:hypothetical protein
MVAQEPAPAWLQTDWALAQFGQERSRAQAGYAAFVRQGIGQASVWEGLRHQVILGTEGRIPYRSSCEQRLVSSRSFAVRAPERQVVSITIQNRVFLAEGVAAAVRPGAIPWCCDRTDPNRIQLQSRPE